MRKHKVSYKKAYKRLLEETAILQRAHDRNQAELTVANAHLKFVITDWNTLSLTLYRRLAIRVDGKVNDEWVARDAASGEEIARYKTMPEIFEIVLLLRLDEAWKRGSFMSHYDNPTPR